MWFFNVVVNINIFILLGPFEECYKYSFGGSAKMAKNFLGT